MKIIELRTSSFLQVGCTRGWGDCIKGQLVTKILIIFRHFVYHLIYVNKKAIAVFLCTVIFFLFVGFGRKDVVEHLLQTGANVHARDDGGLIPLHNACSFGHAEVVTLLLCQGADPNARDNWNYTPLHEAAIKGKIDVCIGECLLY